MVLVGYSDSEGSDDEQPPSSNATPANGSSVSKPSFQKVVDKSKPNKIQVSLPMASPDRPASEDGPPAKRARTAGGFGGFNSFLPAPRNAAASKPSAPLPPDTGKTTTVRTNTIGRGVSLKTGAAPAFSREQPSAYTEDGSPRAAAPVRDEEASPVEEVKLVGKPMAFKPLSVSRKPKKKSSLVATAGNASKSTQPKPLLAAPTDAIPVRPEPPTAPTQKKKTSLFSAAADESSYIPTAAPNATDYTPITLDNEDEDEDDAGDTTAFSEPTDTDTTAISQRTQPPVNPQANDLSTLADTLNLSAAERRQLFGRNGPTNAQVAQFSLAAEYTANRALAESGDATAPAHNPVRSIASGKHSLQQLINNATNQKDALEESFARGKGNKKEAGSKYGW